MDTEKNTTVRQAQRIQTSIINGIERRTLIWLAKRMPRWVTSDMLTIVGVLGSAMIAAGFILTNYSINWLWLSSAGLVVNWFGDSLDGTLARVRNTQRPIYGYYLDHTVDCINEGLMFIGAGLSPLLHLNLALIAFIIYLVLTINVSINAHLKSEFRLTYAKMGPTEFRLLIIIANTLLMAFPRLANYENTYTLWGLTTTFHALDYVAAGCIIILTLMYIVTWYTDLRKYAKMDPKKDLRQ